MLNYIKRGNEIEEKFLTLFLAILCTFSSTNFIFAVVNHTSYQPYGLLLADPWALQPQGAPWCFDTCMKIVLKDAQQKNLAHPLGDGFNIQNINAIINAPVPEEEIVREVLLNNNAIGEIGTIEHAQQVHRQAFLGHITNFFDYYLGNRSVHQRIGGINDSRKINLLNGLLGVALGDEMDDLWGNLDINTRKMIVQESAQAVLNHIQQSTGVTGVSNIIANPAAYNAAIPIIAGEIDNDRMVILVFKNIRNPQQSHACVACATLRTHGNNALEAIGVFNPWGNFIVMNAANPGPFFNIRNVPGAQDWFLNEYITFNY